MLKIQVNLRTISIFGVLLCASMLLSALIMEHIYMIAPCPLCMLQRIVFAALGIVFFLGAIFNFKSSLKYLYTLVIVFFSSIGFAIAARQFWLQYFAPPQKYSCSASLSRLIELHPMLDALKIALTGTAECATVDFTIFTISIAGWSLLTFGMIIILTLYITYLLKFRNLQ